MALSETEPSKEAISLKVLRNAIPSRCFQSSLYISSSYLIRDLTICGCLFYIATLIPLISSNFIRVACWTAYGLAQGFVFVGIWIIAHECGHQAFFKNRITNDSVGFVLHSFLLVPYFSWKFSHGLHHRYTNHMEKDTAFVPPRRSDFRLVDRLKDALHLGEDAPFLNLVALLAHQLVGWPLYLLTHVTSGGESGARNAPTGNAIAQAFSHNHFNPWSLFYTDIQRQFIVLSDIGLLTMVLALRHAASSLGVQTVLLAYGLPYLWVNHWIVAITYLHHNSPSTFHYGAGAWDFSSGALSTVDRDFGFVGRHIFHGIIEYHVIHHLFTKIPFYHAEEATDAIKPLLKDLYIKDETPFLTSLWNTFSSLQYVEPKHEGSEIFVWAAQPWPKASS